MTAALDPETVERFRHLAPREALAELRLALFRAGAMGSEDFLDVIEQLVEAGVLTWADVDADES